MRILVERGLFVDPVVWTGERRQEGARREIEAEDDSAGVRRVDLFDHHEMTLPRAGDAFRRVDEFLPARRHVRCGEGRAVMKFDAVADLEAVGAALVRRLWHFGA